MKATTYLALSTLSVVLLLVLGCGQDQQKTKDLEGNVAKLEEENASLTEKLGAAEATAQQQESDLQKLAGTQDQLAQRTTQFDTEKAAAAALRGELDGAQKRAADAENALAELRAAQQKMLADSQAAAEGAKEQIETLQQQVAELTEQIAELQKALEEATKLPGVPEP